MFNKSRDAGRDAIVPPGRRSALDSLSKDPTLADAILDRLVHNAHRIELTGESLRRARRKQSETA